MLTTAEEQRVASVLKHFGCNQREVEIYLHSLQVGSASIQELANGLKQNRVTVHSAVEQLIDQGFLFETRKGKRRRIAAEEPDVLHRLLQRKQNELQVLKAEIPSIATLLSSVQRRSESVPVVRFYEGVEGLKKMLEETLSAKGEVLVFTYVDLFSKLLSPAYLEGYYRRRADKGISTRLIFPLATFGKRVNSYATKYKMQVKFLPRELAWKSGIFAWNNTVAIQSFAEGKVTCTLIENEDIAHFYRSIIYELCWQQAKPLKS